jgi:putative flippase GtrA
MGSLSRLLRETFAYGLVSVIALGVDTSVFYALATWAGWHYLAASLVAFAAGAIVAYSLSVRFVFPVRRLDNPYTELTAFVVLGLVGLAVNTAAVSLAVSAVGLGLITAKLLAAGCTFATNFTLRRQLLFTPPKAP